MRRKAFEVVPEGKVIPAAMNVIVKFGGFVEVAKLLDVDYQTVRKWTRARPAGLAGIIPSDAMVKLLCIARRRKIDLTPDHFFEGISDNGRIYGIERKTFKIVQQENAARVAGN